MKRNFNLVIIIGISLIAYLSNAQGSAQEKLFAENSNDWISGGDAQWTFNGETLTGDATKGGGFVMTKKTYKYFLLELEFKPDLNVNSGVFLRCANKELSATDCYEINIWDDHPNQAARTGAVVSRSEPLETVQTIDKWNTYKILSNQEGIQAWINDVQVVNLKDNSLNKGFIALQAAEEGSIKFRNVKVQILKN